MKPMIKHNRALDWMALAMNEMVDGKKRAQVAAAFMAKAFAEPDALAAIKTIEATNKAAFAAAQAARIEASKRLQATEEMTDEESEFPVENAAPEGGDEFDFDADPLEYVDDEEDVEVPAVASTTTAAAAPTKTEAATEAPAPAAAKASVKAAAKPVAAEMAETLAAMVRKRDGK